MRARSHPLPAAVAAAVAALAITVLAAPVAGATQSPSPSPTGPPPRVTLQPGARHLPNIEAASWIIADANTGEVLAAKDEHHARPPASTLKTLTAFTLLPRLAGTAKYKARKQDESAEGAHVGIVAGTTYSVTDLMHGMLMPSGNDAASALANANGGWPATIAQMNAEAHRLQANQTVAKTPSGLDEPGQVSSAADLATIFRAGIKLPEYRRLLAIKSVGFPLPAKSGKGSAGRYPIYSENRLLMHGYPGIVGGKTGYTTNAGRTFVAAASRGDRTLVVALMAISSPTEEAANKLLNWGFANADHVQPIGSLPEPLTADAAAATASSPSPRLLGVGSTFNAAANPLERPTKIAIVMAGALGIVTLIVVLFSLRSSRRRRRRDA